MTQTRKRQVPAGYRLRVDGHLDDHWSPWFGDLTLTHEDDGTTSLTGVVADQAELHGLLTKIRDLGVTLISVEVIDPPTLDTAREGWTSPSSSTLSRLTVGDRSPLGASTFQVIAPAMLGKANQTLDGAVPGHDSGK